MGKFKDEMSGKIIEEYVGLRSKMYSIKWSEGNVRTCKGISKSVKKVVLRHEMYKECLMNVALVRYHCHPLMTKGMYWMTRSIPWLMVIMLYQSNLHVLHNLDVLLFRELWVT